MSYRLKEKNKAQHCPVPFLASGAGAPNTQVRLAACQKFVPLQLLLTVSISQWRLLPRAVHDFLTTMQKEFFLSEVVHEASLQTVYRYCNKTLDNTFKKHISIVLHVLSNCENLSGLVIKQICMLYATLKKCFTCPKLRRFSYGIY